MAEVRVLWVPGERTAVEVVDKLQAEMKAGTIRPVKILVCYVEETNGGEGWDYHFRSNAMSLLEEAGLLSMVRHNHRREINGDAE